MTLYCVNCQAPMEVKSNKDRLCSNCYNNMTNLFYKLAAIKYKGEKCEICGWSGHPAGFDFHHTNPAEKEYKINKRTYKNIKKELDKCQLLCSICHRKQHGTAWENVLFISYLNVSKKMDFYQEWIEDDIKIEINKKINENNTIIYDGVCEYCNQPFQIENYSVSRYITKYCSKNCANEAQSTVKDIPSKEELENMHQTMSWGEIADKYNVTANIVRKWRKKYDMI